MTAPMAPDVRCDSCGMPLAAATDHALGDPAIPYCRFCTMEDGTLQPRDERLERFTQWAMRQDGLDYDAARAQAIAYMSTMPAWRADS
ncbi:MAG: zinc ribbon domain-containing protein [Chloroflexota bacterium]